MQVIIPKPPSVNHIYGLTSAGGHARSYITKEGMAWFQDGIAVLSKSFRSKTIEVPVEVWLELYHKRKQDVDNINKPILDLLSKWCVKCQQKIDYRRGCFCGKNHALLKDDDQVYKLTTEKFKLDKKEEEYVKVEIMGY